MQVMLNMLGDSAATELEKKHPRSTPGPRLLIWGGKGRHQAIFNDLYELDLIKVGVRCNFTCSQSLSILAAQHELVRATIWPLQIGLLWMLPSAHFQRPIFDERFQ